MSGQSCRLAETHAGLSVSVLAFVRTLLMFCIPSIQYTCAPDRRAVAQKRAFNGHPLVAAGAGGILLPAVVDRSGIRYMDPLPLLYHLRPISQITSKSTMIQSSAFTASAKCEASAARVDLETRFVCPEFMAKISPSHPGPPGPQDALVGYHGKVAANTAVPHLLVVLRRPVGVPAIRRCTTTPSCKLTSGQRR